jgi:hypothetical protein
MHVHTMPKVPFFVRYLESAAVGEAAGAPAQTGKKKDD